MLLLERTDPQRRNTARPLKTRMDPTEMSKICRSVVVVGI